MPVQVPSTQIQNLQQIEAVVAGPDDANRLFVIDGQFDMQLYTSSQGPGVSQKEIFSVLLGPVLTHKQFVSATATASLAKTNFDINATPATVSWQISNVDADWDDESGQVDLRIEAVAICSGQNNVSIISGFGFHVTILAAVAAG